MIIPILISIISRQRTVWEAYPHHLYTASFWRESKSDRNWKEQICGLLFEQPIPQPQCVFFSQDSHANELALADILGPSPFGHRSTASVRAAMRDLLRVEFDRSAQVSVSRIRKDAASVQRYISSVGSHQARLNGLLSELELLLLSVAEPRKAAHALESLESQTVLLTPTLAQSCEIHSINLLRRSGDAKAADKLFLVGRRTFLPGNETPARMEFWSPIRVPVDLDTFQDGKITSRTYWDWFRSHDPWKF